MFDAVRAYFDTLADRFGNAWNRFWFAPSDPLPLSVLRVLTGLIAFYTVLTYTPDLQTFFGPDGLLKAENIRDLQYNLDEGRAYTTISYLYLLKTPASLWAGHVAGLVVLGLFTIGLFSRVTAVLSLYVVLSYIQRGFMLTSELEPILAFVLLYLCLGPCGAYLSVDRLLARRSSQPRAKTLPSWSATVATRLIQVHLVVVYVMMLLSQLNENTWWDGTAIWWLGGRHDSALIDISWMYAYPMLVNLWTHGFVLYEAMFIVFSWNRLAAPLVVAIGVIVWTAMALVTGLVPWAVMMVVASLAFLPSETLRPLVGCCAFCRDLE